jgi:hypothetical protein
LSEGDSPTTQPLDYLSPQPPAERSSWPPVVSFVLGLISLLLDFLLWQGVFASNSSDGVAFILVIVAIIAATPIVGLIVGIFGLRVRGRIALAVAGIVISLIGLGFFISMAVYFMEHLPIS